MVLTQFRELVLDIIFGTAAIITILAPWRFVYLVYRAVKVL